MNSYGLPDGVSLGMVAAVLIPVGVVTVLLRALPFSMLRVLRVSRVCRPLSSSSKPH